MTVASALFLCVTCTLVQYSAGETCTGVVISSTPPNIGSVVDIRLSGGADLTCDVGSNSGGQFVWQDSRGPVLNVLSNSLRVSLPGVRHRCGYLSTACSTGYSQWLTIVSSPGEVNIHPDSLSVHEGEHVELTCTAVANPTPSFQWFLSGRLIHTGSVLQVGSASQSSQGQYTCKAVNSGGHANTSAFLTVKRAPQLQQSPLPASPLAGSIDLEDILAMIFIILAVLVVLVALALLTCSCVYGCCLRHRHRSRHADDKIPLVQNDFSNQQLANANKGCMEEEEEEEKDQKSCSDYEIQESSTADQMVYPTKVSETGDSGLALTGKGDSSAYQTAVELREMNGEKEYRDPLLLGMEEEQPSAPSHGTEKEQLVGAGELVVYDLPVVQGLDKSHPLSLLEIQAIVEEVTHKTSSNHSLKAEYEAVPANMVSKNYWPSSVMSKNRYRNVIPNRESAVTLSDIGEVGSTYINANFVRGYEGNVAYIAAQAPVYDTIPDFWRMIWERGVNVIVMVTGIFEGGRNKCARYWPPAQGVSKQAYRNIIVTNNSHESFPDYQISYLTIHSMDKANVPEKENERDVYHFWYTGWPDFGVPQETTSLLQFRDAVENIRGTNKYPLLVHCSAGLGRSGAYLAIDMGIHQFKKEGVVDPLRYLCELRKDRGGIIQTVDQYILVHRVLADFMSLHSTGFQ